MFFYTINFPKRLFEHHPLITHFGHNICPNFLLHSDRKPTTSAPSCRHQRFLWDQGWRAMSMFHSVTSFPWCIPTISSSTVWAAGDGLFKAYTLKHERGSVCIWTLESILQGRVEFSDPALSQSRDKDVLILELPTKSILLLNKERISTSKLFFFYPSLFCGVVNELLRKGQLSASSSRKIFYLKACISLQAGISPQWILAVRWKELRSLTGICKSSCCRTCAAWNPDRPYTYQISLLLTKRVVRTMSSVGPWLSR